MRAFRPAVCWLLIYLTALDACGATRIGAGDIFEAVFERRAPATGEHPSVEQLAKEIDWLTHHIDAYGSIVAKQPDIWGQARLTKHRQEYEQQMYAQLNQFKLYVNGSISQKDASYLALSFALSAAASSDQPRLRTPDGTTAITPPPINFSTLQSQVASTTGQGGATSGGTNPPAITIDSRATPTAVPAGNFAPFAVNGIALEPTIALDQMSRYLQHLHELRRINEGDDTADSPGYSLNLVRIPVSILPGKHTRLGYGAEITVTAEPYLTPDLLPTTFRSMVVNDLVDVLGLPITRAAERRIWEQLNRVRDTAASLQQSAVALAKRCGNIDNQFVVLQEHALTALEREDAEEGLEALSEITKGVAPQVSPGKTLTTDQKIRVLIKSLEAAPKSRPPGGSDTDRILESGGNDDASNPAPSVDEGLSAVLVEFKQPGEELPTEAAEAPDSIEELKSQAMSLLSESVKVRKEATRLDSEIAKVVQGRQALDDLSAELVRGTLSTATSPTGRSRAAANSVPPTQIDNVFGTHALSKTAESFQRRYYGPNVRWRGDLLSPVHLLDAQRFLQDELQAAFEFLNAQPDLWGYVDGLAELIRSEKYEGVGGIDERRRAFFMQLRSLDVPTEETVPADVAACDRAVQEVLHEANLALKTALDLQVDAPRTTVEALAWAIIVESALLNAQLLDDMQRISVAKGCPGCVCPSGMMYLPDPTEEDRMAFMEYVRCRWPIHVFALDPVTQDQNIAEEYSRTRELQLAASLAFVTGEMNTAAFMRFSRTLQYDLATITLNRTVAGFSHGDDTFGWRFYPRLQPPRPKGTIRVMGETLFGGPGPDADLLDRGIEPGMRECVAIVIMPSFVPYVTFDVHSNWFRLNQKHGLAPWKDATEISMVDTVKLSRSVRSMREQAQMICDAGMYRDGEVDRLLRRVHQLDRELPLQTMQGLVPIENTLGGFELFNAGVTDLAPELSGWYGAPGILIGDMPTPAPHCSNEAAPMGSEAMTQYLKPVTDSNLVAPLPPPKDCTCSGTTLFLVGKHFSVHDTKVIAGGKCIPYFTLLSREVMRVTIPPDINIDEVAQAYGPNPTDFENRKFVDVHVATPYGVTGHLHIPVYEPSKKEAPKPAPEGSGVKWKPGEIQVAVTFDKNGNLANAAVDGSSAPAFALINENTGKLGYPLMARLRFVAARIKDKTLPLSKPYEPKCIEPTKFFANKTEYDLKLSDDLTTVLKALFEGAGINATNLPDAVIADAAIVFGQGFRVEPFDNTLTLRLVKATSSGGGAAGPTASNADLSPRRLAGPPPSTAARH